MDIETINQEVQKYGSLEEFAKERDIKSITDAYKEKTSKILNIGSKNNYYNEALVGRMNHIKWKTPEGEVKSGKYPFVIAKAIEKLDRGEDFKLAIVGQTGRGKSMKALLIAEILHDIIGVCYGDWTSDFQIYDVKDLLKTLSFRETDVRNGFLSTYIFDESARTLPKERYNSKLNSSVRQVLNLQRVRTNVYIFVLPYFEKLDVGIKKHIDMKLKCLETKKRARCWYNVKKHEAGSNSEASSWKKESFIWKDIPLPAQRLIDEYNVKESLEKFQQPDKDLEAIRKKERERDGGGAGIFG